MPLSQGSVIVGNHAFFFRDGDAYTVPSGGTAGRTSKPGATDTGWVDFGILESLDVEYSSQEREVYAPTPGQIRLYDVLETKRMLSVEFTCEEMQALVYELLFGTLKLTSSSTQFNPLEGITKKGWLKIQQYNHADALINTVDLYCQIKPSGKVSFQDDIVKAPFKAKALHSTLNTGTL